MTYMEQIAKMLGVEIGEEFKIEGYDNNLKFQFTKEAFVQSMGDVWITSVAIMNVLEGNRKLIKLPKSILTQEEKLYLQSVIEPFRNNVKSISKYPFFTEMEEYLGITFHKSIYNMYFPSFAGGSMYQGMQLNKEYTLEELGL